MWFRMIGLDVEIEKNEQIWRNYWTCAGSVLNSEGFAFWFLSRESWEASAILRSFASNCSRDRSIRVIATWRSICCPTLYPKIAVAALPKMKVDQNAMRPLVWPVLDLVRWVGAIWSWSKAPLKKLRLTPSRPMLVSIFRRWLLRWLTLISSLEMSLFW